MNRQQRRACRLKAAEQPFSEQHFQEWQERNRVRLVKMAIMVAVEWEEHLRAQGIDPTPPFSKEIFVPELGITYREACYPDALKDRFHEWFHEEFLPRMTGEEENSWRIGVQGVSPSVPLHIRKQADQRIRQAMARTEALRGRYQQTVSLAQKAGPFKEPYTVLLLLEAESGETPVTSMKVMKETDEYLVQIGATPTCSRYYTSICEALSILQPQAEP